MTQYVGHDNNAIGEHGRDAARLIHLPDILRHGVAQEHERVRDAGRHAVGLLAELGKFAGQGLHHNVTGQLALLAEGPEFGHGDAEAVRQCFGNAPARLDHGIEIVTGQLARCHGLGQRVHDTFGALTLRARHDKGVVQGFGIVKLGLGRIAQILQGAAVLDIGFRRLAEIRIGAPGDFGNAAHDGRALLLIAGRDVHAAGNIVPCFGKLAEFIQADADAEGAEQAVDVRHARAKRTLHTLAGLLRPVLHDAETAVGLL